MDEPPRPGSRTDAGGDGRGGSDGDDGDGDGDGDGDDDEGDSDGHGAGDDGDDGDDDGGEGLGDGGGPSVAAGFADAKDELVQESFDERVSEALFEAACDVLQSKGGGGGGRLSAATGVDSSEQEEGYLAATLQKKSFCSGPLPVQSSPPDAATAFELNHSNLSGAS
jgi:hypothetical protein